MKLRWKLGWSGIESSESLELSRSRTAPRPFGVLRLRPVRPAFEERASSRLASDPLGPDGSLPLARSRSAARGRVSVSAVLYRPRKAPASLAQARPVRLPWVVAATSRPMIVGGDEWVRPPVLVETDQPRSTPSVPLPVIPGPWTCATSFATATWRPGSWRAGARNGWAIRETLDTYMHAVRRCQEAADDVADLASGAKAGRFLPRSGLVRGLWGLVRGLSGLAP